MVLSRVCSVAVYITILVTVTENKLATFDNTKYEVKDDQTRLAMNTMLGNLIRINEEKLNVLKKYTVLEDFNKLSGALRQPRYPSEIEPPVLGIVMLKNYNLESASAEKEAITTDTSDESYNNKYGSKEEYEDNEDEFYKNSYRHTDIPIDIDGIRTLGGDYTIREVENFAPNKETVKKLTPRDLNIDNSATSNVANNLNEHSNSSIRNILRMWNKCTKEAVKMCKKACKKAFKHVCEDYMCSRSMKKALNRQCKADCRKYFNE